MPTTELFNGIAVVIDDQIGKEGENINKLIEQIEKKSMPCVKYTSLPENEIINHLQGISFLILDWMIFDADSQDDPHVNSLFYDQIVNENIEFLKNIKAKCFIPVFIFTNESLDRIITVLKENDLYTDDKPNFIFVKDKSDLDNDLLFAEINTWIQTTPSIYTLKAWEKEYGKAKNLLFLDFYNMNHSWPTILWKNFKDDSVNMSKELGEVISRNLHTRMTPFSFNEDYLIKDNLDADKDEIRKVIEGERFIDEERLHDDSIVAGDVFTRKHSNKKLYLNIRPDCDCIPDRSNSEATQDDVKLYFIKGNILSQSDEKEIYIEKYGNFTEREYESFVFSMINGKSYIFNFKDIITAYWKNYKDKRIGRLLPPYITRIQQRFSFYLQRQGLPRTPEIAVTGSCTDTSESAETSSEVVE
jgi:hypothetical protein